MHDIELAESIAGYYRISEKKFNEVKAYYIRQAEALNASEDTSDEGRCRALVIADGDDPDKEAVGFGYGIPKDQKYRLWEARKPVIEHLKRNYPSW